MPVFDYFVKMETALRNVKLAKFNGVSGEVYTATRIRRGRQKFLIFN